MENPTDRGYTREHQWARIEGGEAVVGITWHAQDQLGDVVYLELPAPGTVVAAGQPYGTIESVKTVSELFAPLSGEVIRSNGAAAATPELVNRDPYGVGWLVVLRPTRPEEEAELLGAADYGRYVEEERRR